MATFHLATFEALVTPPLGHPLCGGWIDPAKVIDDPLRALGVVLLGEGSPIVICALDWCGLRNSANQVWRQGLARAAQTTPDRVALHCVHPHDAPFVDLGAQSLLEEASAGSCVDKTFFQECIDKTSAALKASLAKTERVTHIGTGQAQVREVASNRRVLGPDGKVKYWRGSATSDAKAREQPEGLIDPWLKVLSFWSGDKSLAALHYYACHPMSVYGKGRVSSDFCGLARQKRQDETPGVKLIYFNGCGGNIAAGKYNDGNPANRPVLRDRMHAGMKAAWEATERRPLDGWVWKQANLLFEPRPEATFGKETSLASLKDPKSAKGKRGNAAFQIAWLDRISTPIILGCLDLGTAAVVHLPGEPFIEYQLYAQDQRKGQFVCVAGYGDDGPGYIPVRKAYAEGAYETTVALAAPSCEDRLKAAIDKVLQR